MKVLGLDLGNKTLGIAISDIERKFARGLETVRFDLGQEIKALNRLLEITASENIKTVILGLPKNMDGSIGSQGQKTLDFKQYIESESTLEVIMIDERLTTRIASSQMLESKKNRKKRQSNIDQEAAAVILQSYLDIKK